MARGIRSYGHGKFHTIVDSYVYALTLDGGADRETSYPEGGGWYGFVELADQDADSIRKVAAGEGDQLTEQENELLDASAAVILYERSDGIVETDWYDDLDEADQAWAEILVDTEEEEDEEEDG